MTAAIATLTTAFNDAFARLGESSDEDRTVVVTSWPSVPIEVIRAAGLRAVVVRGSAHATPRADAHLEAHLFPSRLRHLVDAALAGRLSSVAHIVVPRTSDSDYECFLYLREFVRTGLATAVAPTVLFDLLQSSGALVSRYDEARVAALIDTLSARSGRRPSDDDLRLEILSANAARAAARRLLALRRGAPRLTGAEAVPLLGAFWQTVPVEYAALASAAADEIARRPPLGGPRLLLAGSPIDGTGLHEAIESRGAIVVAEISPWGSDVAGDDVRCDGDPVAALAEKYRTDSIGARVPVAALRQRTERALHDVDAVVVSLPDDDTTFGWDYPGLRDLMDARGLPHTVLRGDPYRPMSLSDQTRLDGLVAVVAQLQQVRHG